VSLEGLCEAMQLGMIAQVRHACYVQITCCQSFLCQCKRRSSAAPGNMRAAAAVSETCASAELLKRDGGPFSETGKSCSFYGLNYAFAHACFYDTSMGHYTWYLLPCSELSHAAGLKLPPYTCAHPQQDMTGAC
jgi:hypothetical protein